MIYIFITYPNKKKAEEIVTKLLKERLIACGSILPEVESHYLWEGKIESSFEVKMILKTRKELFDKIEKIVQINSPYEICEIAAVETVLVSKEYKTWVEDVLVEKTN